MTNREQSIFFLLIIFLFTSGAGLLVYKNYNDYYSQKTATELETATTSEMPAPELKKTVALSTSEQISGWQNFKNGFELNTEYNFEFQYPTDWSVKINPEDPNSAVYVCGPNFGCNSNYIGVIITDAGMAEAYIDPSQLTVNKQSSQEYNNVKWQFFTADQPASNVYTHIAEAEVKGQYYVIALFDDTINSTYLSIWNNLISTFKFTN